MRSYIVKENHFGLVLARSFTTDQKKLITLYNRIDKYGYKIKQGRSLLFLQLYLNTNVDSSFIYIVNEVKVIL